MYRICIQVSTCARMSDDKNSCTKVNDVFEELCRQLSINDQVGNISQKFSTLNTNAERVKFAGELLEKYALYPKVIHQKKDDELSIKYRQEGNDAFKSKQDHAAWNFYTKSISYATSNSECLALAYANRSAVLYEKKMYKQCLEDITNAFKNNYPKRLHEKLIQREEKARELQSSETTDRYFERPSGLKETNREIPCASAKVEIRRTKALGRHVVAKKRIKIGEMVAVERPFVSVLLKDHLRDHCYSCLTLCYSTIPCERCVYAMFCSRTCQQQAWEQHHKYECPMLATLYAMDVSKMTLAALRIALVARKHYGELDKYNGDRDGAYRSESYGEIHALEANTGLRNSSDLFPKATAAAVVRYVADRTSPSFHTEFVGVDAATFDELLMHHQQTAATNFHEISECAEDEDGRYVNALEIGVGAYAFLSLFNHSCSPNVVRHCHGTEIIARAIKEIPAGVELLDNYGYHYAVMRKADRKRELQRQYFFGCECAACHNDWPLYKNLPQLGAKSYDMPELEPIMRGDRAEAIRILTFLLSGQLKTVVCNAMPEPNKFLADFQETVKQCYALLGNRKPRFF